MKKRAAYTNALKNLKQVIIDDTMCKHRPLTREELHCLALEISMYIIKFGDDYEKRRHS